MIWMTSRWTQRYVFFLSMSLFELDFFGKSAFFQEINSWNPSDNYFKRLKSWSRNRQNLPDCPRLTGSGPCGEKHLCYVIELFIFWIPKPLSLPARCSVWEASVTSQSKLGKTGSYGFLKHAISKIWIESTGSGWCSSGKISQDWELSLRFRKW